MKKTLAIIMVVLISASLLAACGGGSNANNGSGSAIGYTGKYILTAIEDDEGNNWLELLAAMSELADEGGEEFDAASSYIELLSGGKCVMSVFGESSEEGTYTVEGNSIVITFKGYEYGAGDLAGTIEDNRIILEDPDEGLKMIFEK